MIIVPFTPPAGQALSILATLDGAAYQLLFTWNVAGGRWYVSVLDADGSVLVTLPRWGSAGTAPSPSDRNILAGYFVTSTLVYRTASNQIELGP